MNDKRLEPMAYLCENAVGHKYFRWKKPPSTYKPIALYTLPSQHEWAGLTTEEILEITGVKSTDSDWNVVIVHKWIRAIEAKLKEKNAF